MPIYVSRGAFALRYEVPKFLPRGGHLCMAVLTIAAPRATRSRHRYDAGLVGPRAPYGCRTAAAAATAL